MRALLLLALALPALAQTVMLQPVSLAASNAALGKPVDVGLWVVSVILPPGSTTTRVAVLMAAPTVRALPNRQAEAILARKVFADPRSTVARIAAVGLQLAPVALTAAGVATGTSAYSWAGLGTSALTLAIPALRTRAPDAGFVSASDLLPESIDRTGQWFVVASLSHGAAPIGPLRIEVMK